MPNKTGKEERPQRRETSRHQESFEAWYRAGRSFRKTSQNLAVKERTIYDWADWFNWHERADERDAKAAATAEKKAIEERVKRLEQQRKAGSLLRGRGTEFFAKNEIESAKDAICAVKAGIEIERQSDGLPDWLVAVMMASPDELSTFRSEAEAEIQRRAMERRGVAPFSGGGEDEAADDAAGDSDGSGPGLDAPAWGANPSLQFPG